MFQKCLLIIKFKSGEKLQAPSSISNAIIFIIILYTY